MRGRRSSGRHRRRRRVAGPIALLTGLVAATLAGTVAFAAANAAPAEPAPTSTVAADTVTVATVGTPSPAGTAPAGPASTAAPIGSGSPTPAATGFVVTDQVVALQPERSAAAVRAEQRRIAAAKARARTTAALKRMRPAGSAQRYAALKVLGRGWSERQFTCLVALWGHESGWNAHAGSAEGAYGIPQAYPGSKMGANGGDWVGDARVQIRWGLAYVEGHYGTPCAAWAHWQGARSY